MSFGSAAARIIIKFNIHTKFLSVRSHLPGIAEDALILKCLGDSDVNYKIRCICRKL